MWISRKEFNELRKRVADLEDAGWCVKAPHGAKLGRVVDLILDHLGITIQRSLQHDYVEKKGGPERG